MPQELKRLVGFGVNVCWWVSGRSCLEGRGEVLVGVKVESALLTTRVDLYIHACLSHVL